MNIFNNIEIIFISSIYNNFWWYIILKMNNKFSQKIDNLPNISTQLHFSYNFNWPINNLPHSITHLTFSYKFNQSVDNLPNSITHLTFGHDFNQCIDHLPLIHLIFDYYFDQLLKPPLFSIHLYI